jgi:hypothetical protein
MRIAFLGNFHVDYSSESHYLKTLRALGHEVVPLQEGNATASEVREESIKSDALFWVHTHGWETPGIAAVLQELKDRRIPSFGYHLDLWKGLHREADLKTDPYWNIEYFFTVDPSFVPDLTAMGIKAFHVPAGVFADECYIGDWKQQYAHDVIFVGSRGYHPEWPYREHLIATLEQNYGDRFAQYGGGGLGTIRGSELNDLYASAKVVMGDTLCPNFNYPGYFSDRVFETTGRGGFIIHPYILGIDQVFNVPVPMLNGEMDTSNAEIVTYPFGNLGHLMYEIDYYLQNDVEREAIRMRGHERTKKTNTYTHRLTKILQIIAETEAKRAVGESKS